MSTILKALRRLEREKSAYEARPLQDEIAAAGPPASGRRFPLVGVMAATAALGLGLGASLLWLWPRAGENPLLASASGTPRPAVAVPAVPSAPPVEVAQPLAPAPPPVLAEPEAVAAPVASAPPPQAFASPVEVVERPAPTPAVEPAPAPPAEAAAVVPAPAASPESPPKPGELPPFDYRSRTAQKTPSAPAPAPAARPVEVAKLESPTPPAHTRAPARSEPVAAATPPAPAPAQPVRRKPPPEKIVRANLPDVFVSSTVWHPQKDRRLAKVSLSGGVAKDLHEGDAIGPLVVSRIEPSGVIFVHDGVELRRRVGAKN